MLATFERLGQLAVLCCIELVGGSSKRKQVCVLLLLLFLLLLQASCYFRRKSDQWKVPTTTNLTGLETRKMHGFDECEEPIGAYVQPSSWYQFAATLPTLEERDMRCHHGR